MPRPFVRVAVAVALSFFGVAAATRQPPKPRPNILLLVLDTVRYDAITPQNAPFLTSLAARGITFKNAYSTHDFTPTSHFSMLTGLRDGLGTDDDRPENGIAWQLGRAGYHTFATAANGLIGKAAMPTMRGFADFRDVGDVHTGKVDALASLTEIDVQLALFRLRPTPHARAMVYFNSERLLPLFLQQIRTAKGPYFGFVNLVDAHEPYVPDPDEYRPEPRVPAGFDGDLLRRRVPPEQANPDLIKDPARRAYIKSKLADVKYPRLLAVDLPAESRAIYHRRYMATIEEMDGTLKEFFDVLDREHLLDNTVVIVTSDHGESFGEADLMTHMFNDKGDPESTHHVPLIVVLPKSMHPTASVVDRRISTADLAPTIYDLAGVDWKPFRTAHPQYAPSFLSTIVSTQPQYASAVAVPKSEKQDQSGAEQERKKMLKSLGYLQ